MAKVLVKLTEMTSAEPTFVSLVKRGANRIPFRIVKSQGEDDMGSIDLTSFKRHTTKRETTKKTATPVVVAFVVEKLDDMSDVAKALTDAGFSVEKMEELGDGTVAYHQTDDALDSGTVVRVSDNSVAVIKDMDDTALKGFAIPGVDGYTAGADLASLALKSAVVDALGTDTGNDMVKKAVADYSAYVTGLLASVPANVFKADAAITAVLKARKKKPVEGSAAEEAAETAAQEAAEQAAKKAEDERIAAEAAAAEAAKKNEGKTQEEIDAEAAAAAEAASVEAKIAKANEAMLASVTEIVAKALAPITEAVGAIEGKIKEVATKADAVEKAVKGTVVAGAPEGDRPSGEPTKKDDKPRPIYDTAWARKQAQYNR